ncbi:hypothetical protein FRC12_011602 [Ceratobasidium sp. 428]|nr:hypothetical protein FRC12_011602 [Ceratobasidium sp. 428]
MESPSIVHQLSGSPEHDDPLWRVESRNSLSGFDVDSTHRADQNGSPLASQSDSLHSNQSDELEEFIEELILHLRKQTDREEALVALARLFSVVTEMEDLELWIYRSYVALCMPKSNEIGAYSNSELVKMFGQVTSDSSEITTQHYDGTIAWLHHSASVLMKDFHQDNLTALEQAKIYLDRALNLSSARHKLKPSLYNNLAKVYVARFQRLGELEDLDSALQYHLKATALVSSTSGDTLSALYHSNLSHVYIIRFQRLGKLDDISQAMHFQCRAISSAGTLKGDLPDFYARLGDIYEIRYQRLNSVEDIQNAIYNHQVALFLAQKYGRDLAGFYRGLGRMYHRRFDRLGNEADAEKAIQYFEQAVDEAGSEGSLGEKVDCLSDLGAAYRARFHNSGSQEHINTSISCHTQGLLLLPEGHAAMPMTLFRLGSAFHSKADYSGEIEDIDKAISHHIQALSLTPDDSEQRSTILGSGLGGSYESRFERLGDCSDIDKAIVYRHLAVQMTPEDHPRRLFRLAELSSSYMSRHKQLGDLQDLDQAIGLQLQLVSLAPNDDANKPIFLDNLGRAYIQRFEHGHCEQDLDQAISKLSESITLYLNENQELSAPLISISGAYIYRFQLNGQHDDIDKAIEAGIRARRHTPSGHTSQLLLLTNLGSAYKLRYTSLKDPKDLDMSIDAFRAAASCKTGHPPFQLDAAREWAKLCTAYDIPSLLDAYRQIMKLVPQVVWLGTTVQHRYRDISTLGDSVAEAIVTAIELENYDLALEWFEQGRAVVWKQTLHLRTPIDRLRDIDPKLSNRIEVVGQALDRAIYSKPTGMAMTKGVSLEEQSAQKHRQLAREWEDLMEEVRNVLGDDNPFQPRKAGWLMNAASSGPVIAINVHADRCDALVLKPGCSHVSHVLLPSLSLDKLVDASQLLSLSLRRPGVRHSQKRSPVFYYPDSPHDSFSEVLKLLWLDIVEPIIKYLGYKPRSNVDELPHVTWCTAGPLAFLPLHAAGRYDESESTSKTYNYMISSYTPTISTLLAPTKSASSFHGILTVGQANLGTVEALPATVDELDVISKHAENLSLTRLDEKEATPTAVLEAIRVVSNFTEEHWT